ncbi:MAG: hypothetical protein CMN67_10175 [Sphingomonadaceae bacterium]|nr:hypothetical protein [Sphingomonadaceae bacterium]
MILAATSSPNMKTRENVSNHAHRSASIANRWNIFHTIWNQPCVGPVSPPGGPKSAPAASGTSRHETAAAVPATAAMADFALRDRWISSRDPANRQKVAHPTR